MNNIVGTPKELITKLLNLDDTKKYVVSEYKEKRTLNQNSYYWKLLGELSKKMRIPSEELHRELILRTAPFEDYLVPFDANLRTIEYYKQTMVITKNGKKYKSIRVYTPSHLMDTIEMGMLLDALIDECKEQDIEVLTPKELEKMRSLENDR